MSTRSNTLVIETDGNEEQILVNMYRQMDGYPSGHGKELAEFLIKIRMVNGLAQATPTTSSPTAPGASPRRSSRTSRMGKVASTL